MSEDEHDFGNLFGSEDEASDLDDERQASTSSPGAVQQSPEPAANVSDSEASSEEDEGQNWRRRRARSEYEDSHDEDRVEDSQEHLESEEDSQRYPSKRQRLELNIDIPALPLPRSSDKRYYLAKIPRYIDVDPEPFEPDKFHAFMEKKLIEKPDQKELLRVERTIRYRKVVDENGQERLESNANFVEWEDGSMSLAIGGELYDINIQLPAETNLLLAHHTNSGLLESHVEFTDIMTFKPVDLRSKTHRDMRNIAYTEDVKKTRTKLWLTEEDPELAKQQMEIKENERLKAQRRLENQRRRADMRYEEVRMEEEEEEEEEEPEQYIATYESEPEYDSEEEEIRVKRLQSAKRGILEDDDEEED